MTIFGDGTQTRAFSYIDDVAPIMAAAIDEPRAWNEVFNVGADEPWPLNRARRTRRCGDGRRRHASGISRRVTKSSTAHSSHEKIRSVLGGGETTTLDDGLRAMAEWVKQQGARASKPFEGIEVTKNMPPSWTARTRQRSESAEGNAWRGKTISVVLPAYNEEGYIRPAVEDFFVPDVVDEVIVVDNNSREALPRRRARHGRASSRRAARDTATRFSAASRKPRATSSFSRSRMGRSSAATS